MEDLLRIPVRQLVEFSIHGEDIRAGGFSMMDMMEGMRGHKGRQSALLPPWEKEVPLSLEAEMEGVAFLISGRMDAFRHGGEEEAPSDDGLCVVEEIKLLPGKYPIPARAFPAHMAQAICYGHILCAERGYERVQVRVTYVTSQGKVRAIFQEEMEAEALAEAFHNLLRPLALWEARLRVHRRERDDTIGPMAFPYDSYRAGQREMAVQVFTAVRRRRRLFASMPTGTGKSAAVLFPALKAMGQGDTGQIFYLTARTTARQGALDALSRMREKGLFVWAMTLTAKEKVCPTQTLCDPEFCPRAKGHYLREPDAIFDMMKTGDWSTPEIVKVAERHCVCPFEFSLALTEVADVVICDYNYAFDPGVHLKRIFDLRTNLTLLVDEAHNLADRVREMLSGELSSTLLREYRKNLAKIHGRKGELYKALTGVLKIASAIPMDKGTKERELEAAPEGILPAVDKLAREALEALSQDNLGEVGGDVLFEVYMMALTYLNVAARPQENYALLCRKQGKDRNLRLYCLEVGDHLAEITRELHGTVYFSATLSPLEDMRLMLGGNYEDACFSLPSPFLHENLLVLRRGIDTKYHKREETAPAVAEAILTAFRARPGKYIAFFSSYAYLRLVYHALADDNPGLPVLAQQGNMTEEDREEFLAEFTADDTPLLGMAVLGGIFAEGIDLPGERLVGTMIVGVGMPMLCLERDVLSRYYEKQYGAGFAYAYQYPGMHKVLQAAGRVIRDASDKGVVLLIDNRYFRREYVDLCPPHWHFEAASLPVFWQEP